MTGWWHYGLDAGQGLFNCFYYCESRGSAVFEQVKEYGASAVLTDYIELGLIAVVDIGYIGDLDYCPFV